MKDKKIIIYLVLSFDDGLLDFKDYALPILKKYNIKATINVVLNYINGQILTKSPHLTLNDIILLKNLGHEIAVHSSNHMKNTTIEDFDACRDFLKENIEDVSYGAVLPYSQRISSDLLEQFRMHGYSYLCDVKKRKVKKPLSIKLLRLVNHFFRKDDWSIFVDGYKYVYSFDELNNNFPCFARMPATREFCPEYLIKFLKKVKKSCCVSLMFHSILPNLTHVSDWPPGAWTIDEFNYFISSLFDDERFVFVTQSTLLELLKKV